MTLPTLLHRALRRAATTAVPRRWSLPAMARIDQWQGIEPESTRLALIGPCRGIAIDIGANYGLYSYALSKLYRRVVAFEPNRGAVRPLAAWNSPRVKLEHCGLSSAPRHSNLYIPTKDGVEMAGWASLDPRNCPDADSTRAIEVDLVTLDSFAFTDVGFIKIDAEGHELEILKGSETTIRSSRPHLLVEVRQNGAEVDALMQSWGYRKHRLEDLCGVAGSPANWVFLPASR